MVVFDIIRFLLFTVYPIWMAFWKFCLYVIIPAAIYANPSLMGDVICQNKPWPWPFPLELDQPGKYGLQNATNLRINTSNGQLGAWHILPEIASGTKVVAPAGIGSSGRPIIVYCHGNSDTRGKRHRVVLYQLLVKEEFEVLAFDYRGFGDSDSISGPPTEETLVADTRDVYYYVDRHAPREVPIFVWGHSLGTGVVCRLARDLENTAMRQPRGVVLEAPFFNMEDLILNHSWFKYWAGKVFYERHILDSVKLAGFEFRNCDHVAHMNVAILLLHSDDDAVIKFEIGFRLYEVAKRRINNLPREFYGFVGNRGYGHNKMVDAKEFPEIIQNFVLKCLNRPGQLLDFDTVTVRSSETKFFGPMTLIDQINKNYEDDDSVTLWSQLGLDWVSIGLNSIGTRIRRVCGPGSCVPDPDCKLVRETNSDEEAFATKAMVTRGASPKSASRTGATPRSAGASPRSASGMATNASSVATTRLTPPVDAHSNELDEDELKKRLDQSLAELESLVQSDTKFSWKEGK